MHNPKEEYIKLPAREGAPEIEIFTKQYINENMGDRNTVILLPGGPGNDMSMYDDPNMSIAKTFFQVADVILFDPRACGKSQKCDLNFCSLDFYIDDIEAMRNYFNLNQKKILCFWTIVWLYCWPRLCRSLSEFIEKIIDSGSYSKLQFLF